MTFDCIRKKSSLSLLSIAGVKPYKVRNNERYMSKMQLLHFKRILEAWFLQIKTEIDFSNNYFNIQDKSNNFPDLVDRASREEEFSFELRVRDRERKLMNKIQRTLNKIIKKKFGFCEFCGIEIGIKRLEARPTADLCIDCKLLDEIREKQILR